MTPSPSDEAAGGSPLEAIASLERELSERLSGTRRRAERLIERAEREARRGLDTARSSLPTVCDDLRDAVLREHRRRADAMRDSWGGERERLLARSNEHLPSAVDRVVVSFLDALKDKAP
jgi:vacuolar-type H+-ATPase subunit H